MVCTYELLKYYPEASYTFFFEGYLEQLVFQRARFWKYWHKSLLEGTPKISNTYLWVRGCEGSFFVLFLLHIFTMSMYRFYKKIKT